MKGGFYIHTTTFHLSPVLLQISSGWSCLEATSHTLSATSSHKEETNRRLRQGGHWWDMLVLVISRLISFFFFFFARRMCTHVSKLKGEKTTQNTLCCLWLTSGAERTGAAFVTHVTFWRRRRAYQQYIPVAFDAFKFDLGQTRSVAWRTTMWNARNFRKHGPVFWRHRQATSWNYFVNRKSEVSSCICWEISCISWHLSGGRISVMFTSYVFQSAVCLCDCFSTVFTVTSSSVFLCRWCIIQDSPSRLLFSVNSYHFYHSYF